MQKLRLALIAVLTVLLILSTYKIIAYETVIPRLVWAVDTLYLDYEAQQRLTAECRFSRQVPM